MSLQGIHGDEFSKRFQALNEISIPGHRANPGRPGEELFAEFQDVLDKIAVALNTGDSGRQALDDLLKSDIPALANKPEPKKEATRNVPIEVEAEATRPEKTHKKDTASKKPVQEKESEKEATEAETVANEVSATEETEAEAIIESVAEEIVAESEVHVEEPVTEEDIPEEVLVSESAPTEVETPAQPVAQVQGVELNTKAENKVKESTETEVSTPEQFDTQENEAQDPALLKATQQLVKAKEDARTDRISREVVGQTEAPAGEREAVDFAVKNFMESLRSRLQGSAVNEERPQFEKPVETPVHVPQQPQQNAAMVLSQLILKSATQHGGETTRGLTTAVQNVIAANASTVTGKQHTDEGTASKETQRLPRNFESKTLAKVEEALQEVARSRDGKTISVRLDPPSLGKVKIDVTMREGVLHARLQADSAQVSTLLREHGMDLQYALRKLGLTVDEISITVVPDREQSSEFQGNYSQEGSSGGETHEQEGGEYEVTNSTTAVDVQNTSDGDDTEDHWVA